MWLARRPRKNSGHAPQRSNPSNICTQAGETLALPYYTKGKAGSNTVLDPAFPFVVLINIKREVPRLAMWVKSCKFTDDKADNRAFSRH